MTIDFAFHALRYLMPAIAAAIALISLVKKSKDDGSKAKQASPWFISLIIAALAGAWGIQFLDDLRQERSAETQLKRNSEQVAIESERSFFSLVLGVKVWRRMIAKELSNHYSKEC